MLVVRRIAAVVLLLIMASMSGCAKNRHEMTLVHEVPSYTPTLEDVAKAYTQTCVGGDRKSNNCTHFLSDAFIRAGYTELLTSDLITERCPSDRPVRAQELLKWFQEKSERFHSGRPESNTGYWACYQEKPGRHHVMIFDSATGKVYGTADCKDWPVQWYYQW